jgi:hypothetical protein
MGAIVMGRRQICELNGRDIDYAFANIRDEIVNLFLLTQEHDDLESITFHIQLLDDSIFLITEKDQSVNQRFKGAVATNAIREDDTARMVNNMAQVIIEQLMTKDKALDQFGELESLTEDEVQETLDNVLDKVSDLKED